MNPCQGLLNSDQKCLVFGSCFAPYEGILEGFAKCYPTRSRCGQKPGHGELLKLNEHPAKLLVLRG